MSDPILPLSVLAGRYLIERELGHGGMATVFLARDERHHRMVAVKVLRVFPRLVRKNDAFAFMARQLFKATSSIGSQLEEGTAPSSRRDMAEKHSIGLRESREANHWARLIATDEEFAEPMAPIVQETSEFIAMLTVSVRKLRRPPEASDEADEHL